MRIMGSDQIVTALLAFGVGLILKIVYDWLQGRKTDVPHAQNGFLTLSEIQTHCMTQQKSCAKLIRADLQVHMSTITNRLDNGDKKFAAYKERFDKMDDSLADVKKAVDDLAKKDNRPEIVAVKKAK